jgi:hypothetical protein
MATADNFFNLNQILLAPNIVQNFSKALGQPTEKIQKGLRAILPKFMSGIISKGSSKDGAENLVLLAQRDGIELTPSAQKLNDINYLIKGEDALREIFENDLTSVTSSVAPSAELDASLVKRLMTMAAPMMMGVIRRKIKTEGMNTQGLMQIFNQQDSPQGSNTFQRPVTSYATTNGITPHYASKFKVWIPLALITLAMIAFLWWWTSRTAIVASMPAGEASVVQTVERSIQTENIPMASLSELETFLSSGNKAELPKRFEFSGSTSALNEVTELLSKYPAARVSIHAPSELMAKEAKDQIVVRGIEAHRINIAQTGSAPVLVVTEID